MYIQKGMRRAVALLLTMLLVFGLVAAPITYAEEPATPETAATEPSPTSTPAAEPAPTTEPTSSPAPTTEPTSSPAPTTEPAIATPESAEPIMLFAARVLRAPRTVLTEDIPVIDPDTFASGTKIVLIDGSGSQAGYDTLAAAMYAIRDAAPDGNYTLVFIKDYEMVNTTDQDAITAGTPNAASLTVTSTYLDASSSNAEITKKVSAAGTTGRDWNFNSAQTLVHHFNFNTPGCSRFLACGNDLTMGSGITTSGNNIQLFVGATGQSITGVNGSLTVNSGNYNYVFAAGYSSSNKYTGSSTITIQGNTKVNTLYGGGHNATFGNGSTVAATINGSAGATCGKILSSSYAGTNGLAATDELTVTLQSVTITGANSIDLTASNIADNTLVIAGGEQTSVGSGTTGTAIKAKNLTLEQDATLRTNLGVALTGDLTLQENSNYIRFGTGTQKVDGNLNVTGEGAKLSLYKTINTNSTTTTYPLTIGGSYTSTTNKLGFALVDAAGKPLIAEENDCLLTFNNATNAETEDYSLFYDDVGGVVYAPTKSNMNITLQQVYDYPGGYERLPDIDPDFYRFTQIDGTGGASHIEYRKYVYNEAASKWEVFVADAAGNITGNALTAAELKKERPQPSMAGPVNYNSSFGTMVRLDGIGHYRLAVAAGTNAMYYQSNSHTNSGYGVGADNFFNDDNMGTTNASWAVLDQTNEHCAIRRAYLIMTTTLPNGGDTGPNKAQADALINTPMRLIDADTGDFMYSNGYLPAEFHEGVKGTNYDALNGEEPSLLYHGNPGVPSLGEAMTITDVTDFVKAHGYGKYYGADIPAFGNDPDGAIAWRLVVVEEDPTMENLRKVGIQMGPISNYDSTAITTNTEAPKETTIELSLDGFTTPNGLDSEGNHKVFGGQLLMIGSDNLTGFTSGGSSGSNLHNVFIPNPKDKNADAIVRIPIGTNDKSADDVVDRPMRADGNGDNWSQGIMEHNGTKLGTDKVSHIYDNGAMGLDLSLLDITNDKNENWDKTDGTGGGHNLYLTPISSAVALTSRRDTNGYGYVDVMALSTDIAVPTYDDQIIHTDITTAPVEGGNFEAGETVCIKATALNDTPDNGHVLGTFNTVLSIDVDPELTNIRPVGGGTGKIIATFYDYHRNTDKTDNVTREGTYHEDTHTITFDFGSDFDYDDVHHPETDKEGADNKYIFFNSRHDKIEVNFWADTVASPTIGDSARDYTNGVGVTGHILYQNGTFDDTPKTLYAYDTDTFDTYLPLTLTKLVKGNIADPDKAYNFELTVTDSVSNTPLAKGTIIPYIGGTLTAVPTATAPDPNPTDHTLTVGENGKISLSLKHGQTITFKDLPACKVVVKETGASDYALSWLDSDDAIPRTEHTATKTENESTTGEISLQTNTKRTLDFINTKVSTPPTGVRTKALPFMLLALLLLSGLALTTTQSVADYRRHRRE